METIELKPTNYPSDLTGAQWEVIAENFPQGPNSEYHKHSLVNAVLYIKDNGCKWRALPHDYPPYSTVHSFYRRDGQFPTIIERLCNYLRFIRKHDSHFSSPY